jgi:uncharacterized integral membrane protein
VRFVVLILVVALLACLGYFAVLNIEERVDVTLPGRTFSGVPQVYLVLMAVGIGILFMGILSVVDGARLRLANRRLRREVERLTQGDVSSASLAVGANLETEPAARAGLSRRPREGAADRPAVPAAEDSSGPDESPPYGV